MRMGMRSRVSIGVGVRIVELAEDSGADVEEGMEVCDRHVTVEGEQERGRDVGGEGVDLRGASGA